MLTLYIPDCVHPDDLDCIKETFEKLDLAKVRDVEFLGHFECEIYEELNFGAALIHLDYWYDNTSVAYMKERINDPNQEARIVYDDPNYWVLELADDDTNKIIAGMSHSMRETDTRLTEMNDYLYHNYECVNYLMKEARKRHIKGVRKRRTADNYKAQRRWQRRLRPRMHSPYHVKVTNV